MRSERECEGVNIRGEIRGGVVMRCFRGQEDVVGDSVTVRVVI